MAKEKRLFGDKHKTVFFLGAPEVEMRKRLLWSVFPSTSLPKNASPQAKRDWRMSENGKRKKTVR